MNAAVSSADGLDWVGTGESRDVVANGTCCNAEQGCEIFCRFTSPVAQQIHDRTATFGRAHSFSPPRLALLLGV